MNNECLNYEFYVDSHEFVKFIQCKQTKYSNGDFDEKPEGCYKKAKLFGTQISPRCLTKVKIF